MKLTSRQTRRSFGTEDLRCIAMARKRIRIITELVEGLSITTTERADLDICIQVSQQYADLWLDKICDLEATFEEITAYQNRDFQEQADITGPESWRMVDELVDSYRFLRKENGSAEIQILTSHRFAALWLWKLTTLTATDEEIEEFQNHA